MMDRLKAAEEAGIITAEQRHAIEALRLEEDRAFRFSLVHLLWLGGAGLIIFALVLLAGEISRGQSMPLMWTCLAYAGGFALLDWSLQGRRDLRLLSSLAFLGMSISGMFAVDAALAFEADRWRPMEYPELPLLFVGGLAGWLIWSRGFLPAWLVLGGASTWLAYVLVDPYYSDEQVFFLCAGVAAFVLGWFFDLKARANHGFWLNKIALVCLFIYVVQAAFSSDQMLALLLTSLVLLAMSLFIRRAAGVSTAALGLAAYLGNWLDAWDNLFVAAAILAVVGLVAIFAGVKAHLVEDQLERLLPSQAKRLRPESRVDPVTFGF